MSNNKTATTKPRNCPHEDVQTLRSVPPRSECRTCGAVVERRWVTSSNQAGDQ